MEGWDIAQNTEEWRASVNTATNLEVPYKSENFASF
jgi:hypothetical protein